MSRIVMSCIYDPKNGTFYQEYILLNKGQIICPRCDGMGYHYWYDVEDYEISEKNSNGITRSCWICKGNGFTDWARLPFILNWKETDIKSQGEIKKIKRCTSFEEYWDEIDDQDSSSFIIERDNE